VLHSAFWLEDRLWGAAPLGYHLVNILLHATAAWLFVLALRRLSQVERVAPNALDRTGAPASALGATRSTWDWPLLAGLLFALHPVGVESVAWIAEQKNTLSTVFYLSAALAYLRWDEVRKVGTGVPPVRDIGETLTERTDGRDARPHLYFLATGFFGLALLSKSVAATLPAALGVIIWWRRGRLSWKRDGVPLLPWFAVGAAVGLFTGWVERAYVGAQGPAFDLSLAQRCLVAGRATWFYLGRLLWPANLIFIYPRWTLRPEAPLSWVPVIAAVGILLVLAARLRPRWAGPEGAADSAPGRARRATLACALFFLGSLFPTLGFLNVYAFLYSFVADHWQYLASLGIYAGIAGLWEAWDRRGGEGRSGWWLRRGLAFAVLGLLGVLTWRQARIYRDSDSLYRSILERNPSAWMAHANLGAILMDRGRVTEAVAHFEAAARLAPSLPVAHYDLANALVLQGRTTEAAQEFAEAIRLHPDFTAAHANLAGLLLRLDLPREAAAHYEAALRLQPGAADWELNLGVACARMGRLDEAILHDRKSIALLPASFVAHNDLGTALARSGRWAEAIGEFSESLRLNPAGAEARKNLAQAHFDWGNALANGGRFGEAAAHYRIVLQLRPNDALARDYLVRVGALAAGRQP